MNHIFQAKLSEDNKKLDYCVTCGRHGIDHTDLASCEGCARIAPCDIFYDKQNPQGILLCKTCLEHDKELAEQDSPTIGDKLMIRSIAEIGNLWPRCKECGHIAQSHEGEQSPNGSCCEPVNGQCPTCGIWTHNMQLTCKCKGYVGPTWQEFRNTMLTPEEIKYYHYDEIVK